MKIPRKLLGMKTEGLSNFSAFFKGVTANKQSEWCYDKFILTVANGSYSLECSLGFRTISAGINRVHTIAGEWPVSERVEMWSHGSVGILVMSMSSCWSFVTFAFLVSEVKKVNDTDLPLLLATEIYFRLYKVRKNDSTRFFTKNRMNEEKRRHFEVSHIFSHMYRWWFWIEKNRVRVRPINNKLPSHESDMLIVKWMKLFLKIADRFVYVSIYFSFPSILI